MEIMLLPFALDSASSALEIPRAPRQSSRGSRKGPEQTQPAPTRLLLSSFLPSLERCRSCCGGARVQRHLIVPHGIPLHPAEPPPLPSEPHCTLVDTPRSPLSLPAPLRAPCTLLKAPLKPPLRPLSPSSAHSPAGVRWGSAPATPGAPQLFPLKKPPVSFQPASPVGAGVSSSTHGSSEGGEQWGELGLLLLGCSARGCCWSPRSTWTLSPYRSHEPAPARGPSVRPTAPHGTPRPRAELRQSQGREPCGERSSPAAQR